MYTYTATGSPSFDSLLVWIGAVELSCNFLTNLVVLIGNFGIATFAGKTIGVLSGGTSRSLTEDKPFSKFELTN